MRLVASRPSITGSMISMMTRSGRSVEAAWTALAPSEATRAVQPSAVMRCAMAVAKEQEMKAYTQEMEAKVVEAQAEVPHAMAEALREGRLGVMDYYNLNNVQADTDMRNAISTAGADDKMRPTQPVK